MIAPLEKFYAWLEGVILDGIKWNRKFVIEKEFFSTFALHYLYQGSMRTAKSNFLILHHLQFLMNTEIEWKEYKSNFMRIQFFSFQKLLIAFDQKNRITYPALPRFIFFIWRENFLRFLNYVIQKVLFNDANWCS